MIRRLVGLTLAAAMLQVNIARADSVCADHAHMASQTTPAEHAHSGHHHMSASAKTVASDKDCETPAQRDCCQALVSCSIVLGLDDGSRTFDLATSHDRVAVTAQTAPISRVTAPEPPPPRA